MISFSLGAAGYELANGPSEWSTCTVKEEPLYRTACAIVPKVRFCSHLLGYSQRKLEQESVNEWPSNVKFVFGNEVSQQRRSFVSRNLFIFYLTIHLNPILGFQLTSNRWPSLCQRGCCGSVNEWPLFFIFQNDHPATNRQTEDPAGQSERIPSQIHTEVFIKTPVLPCVHKRSDSSTDRLMNSAN